MSVKDASVLAWSYGALGLRPPGLFATLAREGLSMVHEATAHDLSNLAWGLASAGLGVIVEDAKGEPVFCLVLFLYTILFVLYVCASFYSVLAVGLVWSGLVFYYLAVWLVISMIAGFLWFLGAGRGGGGHLLFLLMGVFNILLQITNQNSTCGYKTNDLVRVYASVASRCSFSTPMYTSSTNQNGWKRARSLRLPRFPATTVLLIALLMVYY